MGCKVTYMKTNEQEGEMYAVKCDECKTVIRRTDSVQESACGGTCDACYTERAKKAWHDAAVAARKERKRQVRLAVKLGTKVPYGLGTLLNDGHSLATIRKVHR